MRDFLLGAAIATIFSISGMWLGLGGTPQPIEPIIETREPGLVFKVSSQCGIELAKELARYVEDRGIEFKVEIGGGFYFYENSAAVIAWGLPESDAVIDLSDFPPNLNHFFWHGVINVMNGGSNPGDHFGYFDNRIPGTTECWGNM